VKPANVFITVEGGGDNIRYVPKVADFGFTQLKEDFMQDKDKALGSPYWMSPELLQAKVETIAIENPHPPTHPPLLAASVIF
jgi:serine/threonine protein kinase